MTLPSQYYPLCVSCRIDTWQIVYLSSKAGHMSNLASLRFRINAATDRHSKTRQLIDTGRLLWITRHFRTNAAFSDQLGALGRQHIRVHVTGDKTQRVEHALLEQLTLFPNTSIVLEDVDKHRSNFCRVKTQTKRRQSNVNTGRVPESENARPQGRPVAGFRKPVLQYEYMN